MRTTLAAVSLLCLGATAALAAAEDRDVAAFNSIHVASGIRATVSIGSRRSVHVEADKDVLPLVETRVDDGTLHVGFKPHSQLRNTGDVTVSVQTPELRAIAGSGGAVVKGTMTKADEAGLSASGGSELHVRSVDARTLVAKASGGGVLQVAGRADTDPISTDRSSRHTTCTWKAAGARWRSCARLETCAALCPADRRCTCAAERARPWLRRADRK